MSSIQSNEIAYSKKIAYKKEDPTNKENYRTIIRYKLLCQKSSKNTFLYRWDDCQFSSQLFCRFIQGWNLLSIDSALVSSLQIGKIFLELYKNGQKNIRK